MTRKTTSLTVEKSRSLLSKLTKVANDLVDVAAAAPVAPEESGAGTAGPQEVVDALEVIADEILEIQQAIPAEPSNGGVEAPVAEAPVEEAPVAESPVEAPVAEEATDEDEEPKLAKQLKIALQEIDVIKRERIATQYAELFEESKVQQAKFDEVIASKDSIATWVAKIDSIEQYKQHEGATSSYKPAKTMTSWIKPQSKFAKQVSNEMLSL